jgi:hypothetical protein
LKGRWKVLGAVLLVLLIVLFFPVTNDPYGGKIIRPATSMLCGNGTLPDPHEVSYGNDRPCNGPELDYIKGNPRPDTTVAP